MKEKYCLRNRLKMLSRIFEYFIITMILLSWILLTLDSPLNNPDSAFAKTLSIVDIIFTFIFFIEAVLKWLAFGFFWNHYNGVTPYIRNSWNILDFCVVVLSLTDFIVSNTSEDPATQDLSSLKALRAIRALRPLRVASRNEGLKIAIQALLASIPPIGNVLIISLLFLLIFAILGVNFFKGAYYYCQTDYSDLLSQVSTRRDCLNIGGVWVRIGANFDNVAIACIVLFEMMTTEGWTDVMANGVDATGIEMEPKYNEQMYMQIYFVVFMIIGWFLLINLFTAVITDNFNKIKETKEIGAGAAISETQKQWVDVQNIALKLRQIKKMKPPSSTFRIFFFELVTSSFFEVLIIIIIVSNTLVNALVYATMSESYSNAIQILNFIFIGLFNIECILKLIGLDKQYFTHDSWNIFDFIWVIGADISIVIYISPVDGPVQIIVLFFRSFRIMRLIRFVNSYGGASAIKTLIYAAPQIQNILTLIWLITFIYAALGINLFADVMYRDNYNDQNNFRDIFNSLLLLIRWMTGESWNAVMHDLASSDPYKNIYWVDNQSYYEMQKNGIKGCGSWFAYPYFISYFIINACIILDLSIGVFINALSDSKKYEKSIFGRKQIEKFLNIWSDYDPDSTGWIDADQLLFLFYELPVPLGYGCHRVKSDTQYEHNKIYSKLYQENLISAKAEYWNRKEVLETDKIKTVNIFNELYLINENKGHIIRQCRSITMLKDFNIPMYEGYKVSFVHVLLQIIKNAFDSLSEEYLPNAMVQAKFERKWKKKTKFSRKITWNTIDEYFAAYIVWSKYLYK